jgi:hypothetical protein
MVNGHPIGTRVRKVMHRLPANGAVPNPEFQAPIGRLGTIAGYCQLKGEYDVHWDGERVPWQCCPYMVEPIRDDWDTDATPNAVASWAGGVWAPERVRV